MGKQEPSPKAVLDPTANLSTTFWYTRNSLSPPGTGGEPRAPARGRGSIKMVMKLFHLSFVVLLLLPLAAEAQDQYAAALFKQHCAACHEAGAAAPGARIPPVSVLKTMTPTAILRALETGIMKTQASVLSTNERQALANFLGTAVTTERRRDEIANPCPAGAGWKD